MTLKRNHIVILWALVVCAVYSTSCHSSKTDKTDRGVEKKSSVAHASVSWQLPRTGQKETYASRDDGDIAAGKPLPMPRFTDNNNGTVLDRLTGLMWTQK